MRWPVEHKGHPLAYVTTPTSSGWYVPASDHSLPTVTVECSGEQGC
jgi:hypothetical protein